MSKSPQSRCLEAREFLLPLEIAGLPLTALYHTPGFLTNPGHSRADAGGKWDMDGFDNIDVPLPSRTPGSLEVLHILRPLCKRD